MPSRTRCLVPFIERVKSARLAGWSTRAAGQRLQPSNSSGGARYAAARLSGGMNASAQIPLVKDVAMVRRDFHPLSFGLRSGAVNGTRRSSQKDGRSLLAGESDLLSRACLRSAWAGFCQRLTESGTDRERSGVDRSRRTSYRAQRSRFRRCRPRPNPSGPRSRSSCARRRIARRPRRRRRKRSGSPGMGVKRIMLQFKQDESDEHEGGTLFFPTSLGPVARGFEDGRLLKFAAGAGRRGNRSERLGPAL